MEDFESSIYQLNMRMNTDLATWNQHERDIKRVKKELVDSRTRELDRQFEGVRGLINTQGISLETKNHQPFNPFRSGITDESQ